MSPMAVQWMKKEVVVFLSSGCPSRWPWRSQTSLRSASWSSQRLPSAPGPASRSCSEETNSLQSRKAQITPPLVGFKLTWDRRKSQTWLLLPFLRQSPSWSPSWPDQSTWVGSGRTDLQLPASGNRAAHPETVHGGKREKIDLLFYSGVRRMKPRTEYLQPVAQKREETNFNLEHDSRKSVNAKLVMWGRDITNVLDLNRPQSSFKEMM